MLIIKSDTSSEKNGRIVLVIYKGWAFEPNNIKQFNSIINEVDIMEISDFQKSFILGKYLEIDAKVIFNFLENDKNLFNHQVSPDIQLELYKKLANFKI